jgi:hypothetical protein
MWEQLQRQLTPLVSVGTYHPPSVPGQTVLSLHTTDINANLRVLYTIYFVLSSLSIVTINNQFSALYLELTN